MSCKEIRAYYFGDQCPWNSLALEQARIAADSLGLNLVEFDLSETIHDLPLFFPFTLIYNDLKIAGPVPSDFIVDVLEGRKTVRPFGDAKRRPTKNCDRIERLSKQSLRDACLVCTNGTGNGAEEKIGWYEGFKGRDNLFGFVSYVEEIPVAFVEVMPSLLSPYSIPKSVSTAFISCIYNSHDSTYDYRSELIQLSVEECRTRGFGSVEALSGKKSPFPNGPASFFLQNGFEDLETVDSSVIMFSGRDDIDLLIRNL